ncbi:MAG TPA: DUF711 family protein [Candidatus Acidoferrum sp.]|nr:DUF711 family protein [Candidatus Acidoferrum sp.]
MFNLRSRLALSFALLLVLHPQVSAQQKAPASKTAAAASVKPRIRAITAFINLDAAGYQQQVADALQMLRRGKTIFESRGFEVQTIRIATQPFPEYTKGMTTQQAIAFFQKYDDLAEKEKFRAAIGPAMLNPEDPETQADLLANILAATKNLSGSIVIAGEDGVRWKALGATARAIKKLEEETEHSQGNFNLGAIAMVPPYSPFFTAAYHTGFGHQFAIALESANVVEAAFQGAPDIEAAKRKLTDMLGEQASEIERHANRVDQETGWRYMGIDLSPAPLKEISIGGAIETLIQRPFGSSGTLTAAGTITAAIKAIQVKQTGYNGLMLPILEDSRLAQRWSEGRVSLEGLLSYSAVCATGIDTVPLPGDVSIEQLDMILSDVATLAFKWHKPLSARLLPVKGRGPGEMTEFDNPFLVNATIQPLEHAGSALQ